MAVVLEDEGGGGGEFDGTLRCTLCGSSDLGCVHWHVEDTVADGGPVANGEPVTFIGIAQLGLK